jgi:hypothetical protein
LSEPQSCPRLRPPASAHRGGQRWPNRVRRLNGLSGTDTSIEYDTNGSRKVKETFTGGVGANGMIILAGHGICTGGTGVHKNEKCSYTLSGTTNPQTNVSSSKEVGTTTR